MTYITAHSGSDSLPENSLDFIKYFIEKPIDAVEIDVRYSKQQECLVLGHDIEQYGELVLLSDVFELLRGNNLRVNCDLKEVDLELSVFELASEYQLSSKIWLSGAVSLNLLAQFPKQILANIENGLEDFLPWSKWNDTTVKQAASNLINHGAEILNLPYQCYTAEFARFSKEHQSALSLWTVNDLKDIAYFEGQNLYNITTRNAWQYYQTRQEV